VNCPHCGHDKSNVIETRKHEGETWRRRKCAGCDKTIVSCEYSQSDMTFPADINNKSLARLREKKGRPRSVRRAEAKTVALDWVEKRYA
jgi:transcriptional regulator NrdR family protein